MLLLIISLVLSVIILCVAWDYYINPCRYRSKPTAMQEALRFTCPGGLISGSQTDCKDLYTNRTFPQGTVSGGNSYKLEDGTTGLRGSLFTRAKREEAKNIFGGFRPFEDETHICTAYGEGFEPSSSEAKVVKAYLDGLCLAQAKQKNKCYKGAEASIIVDSRRKEVKDIKDMCKYGNGVMCSYIP